MQSLWWNRTGIKTADDVISIQILVDELEEETWI